MRKIDQLTAAKVKHLTKPGRYGDGAGLYLEISKGGGKSWVFMWKRDRKRRAMGLGSAHTISLVKARELAKKAAEVVADRLDPIEERKEARAKAKEAEAKSITFAEATLKCHAQIGSAWRSDRHRRLWLASVVNHTKPLSGKLVSEITVHDVVGVLRPASASYMNIPDGTYSIQYAVGGDLRDDCKSFMQISALGQFPQETLSTSFTATEIVREELAYTLYPVPDGNVRPQSLDLAAFNAE